MYIYIRINRLSLSLSAPHWWYVERRERERERRKREEREREREREREGQCCIVVLLFALARNVLRVFGSLYKATSVICGHQHTHTNTHTHTHIPFKVLRTNSTKRAAKSVCVKLIHVTAREREGGREGGRVGGREGGREGVRKGCEKKLEVGVRKIHKRENSRALHACTHEQNCTLRACTALCAKVKCSKNARQPSPWQQASHSR
jgi:hypothetical protein